MSGLAGDAAIQASVDDRGVAWLRLARPDVRNAIDDATAVRIRELCASWSEDESVRVVVVTALGRVFCGGADISRMAEERSAGELLPEARRLAAMYRALDELPKPVLGRVNGHAVGGGAGLVSVCDAAVAVRGARFGFPEARLGLAPVVISPYIVRRIGPAATRAAFLKAATFDAGEALRVGLVDQVVDDDELDATVEEWIESLLEVPPGAAAVIKALVDETAGLRPGATDRTAELIADLRTRPEAREGVAAFLAKRPPAWSPRSMPVNREKIDR